MDKQSVVHLQSKILLGNIKESFIHKFNNMDGYQEYWKKQHIKSRISFTGKQVVALIGDKSLVLSLGEGRLETEGIEEGIERN